MTSTIYAAARAGQSDDPADSTKQNVTPRENETLASRISFIPTSELAAGLKTSKIDFLNHTGITYASSPVLQQVLHECVSYSPLYIYSPGVAAWCSGLVQTSSF